jgi:hypothetical protein
MDVSAIIISGRKLEHIPALGTQLLISFPLRLSTPLLKTTKYLPYRE